MSSYSMLHFPGASCLPWGLFLSNQGLLYLVSTVPSHLKEEDRHELFSFQFDPDDLENLQHEDVVFSVFWDQSGFLIPFNFLFMSSSSGDGSLGKWHASHHIFWKSWHPFHSTLLCDYKYTLAQPV